MRYVAPVPQGGGKYRFNEKFGRNEQKLFVINLKCDSLVRALTD